MPFALSPNQLQERKIYKLYAEGYSPEEISNHMGIMVEGIRLYDPEYVKPQPETIKKELETRAKEAAKVKPGKKKSNKKVLKPLVAHDEE